MSATTILMMEIRKHYEGKLKCASCGNDKWDQFLYVGDLPHGAGMAGCKRCGAAIALPSLEPVKKEGHA